MEKVDNNRPIEERVFKNPQQKIDLSKLCCSGRILDIGGGGEGIIGQLFKDRVVAIDPIKKELEEAPSGPLKIVMDARELKFLSDTFDCATSFFTMMFMKNTEHERVFGEIYRVLKQGGEFLLWDVTIPQFNGGDKDIFAVNLEIDLGGKTVKTGYGALWLEKTQNIEYFINIAKKIGFRLSENIAHDMTYFIKLTK